MNKYQYTFAQKITKYAQNFYYILINLSKIKDQRKYAQTIYIVTIIIHTTTNVD